MYDYTNEKLVGSNAIFTWKEVIVETKLKRSVSSSTQATQGVSIREPTHGSQSSQRNHTQEAWDEYWKLFIQKFKDNPEAAPMYGFDEQTWKSVTKGKSKKKRTLAAGATAAFKSMLGSCAGGQGGAGPSSQSRVPPSQPPVVMHSNPEQLFATLESMLESVVRRIMATQAGEASDSASRHPDVPDSSHGSEARDEPLGGDDEDDDDENLRIMFCRLKRRSTIQMSI